MDAHALMDAVLMWYVKGARKVLLRENILCHLTGLIRDTPKTVGRGAFAYELNCISLVRTHAWSTRPWAASGPRAIAMIDIGSQRVDHFDDHHRMKPAARWRRHHAQSCVILIRRHIFILCTWAYVGQADTRFLSGERGANATVAGSAFQLCEPHFLFIPFYLYSRFVLSA